MTTWTWDGDSGERRLSDGRGLRVKPLDGGAAYRDAIAALPVGGDK